MAVRLSKVMLEGLEKVKELTDEEIVGAIHETISHLEQGDTSQSRALIQTMFAMTVLEQRYIERIEARNEASAQRAERMIFWTIGLAVASLIASITQILIAICS